MNTKHWFLTCFVVCLVLSSYGLCMAQDQTTTLTVKEIAFKADKGGKEKVAILCNQACIPTLSGLEGKNARIIMDFAGVSFMEPKYRNIPVSGKYVKKIRSYLDRDSKKLRVVLDMAPSKHFIVHAIQDQTVNAFSLSIAEKRRAKGKQARTRGSRIVIVDRVTRPLDKAPITEKESEKQEPVNGARIAVETILTIQVITNKEKAKAMREAKRLEKDKFSDVRVEQIGSQYVVRVGKYARQSEGTATLQAIRRTYPKSVLRTAYDKPEREIFTANKSERKPVSGAQVPVDEKLKPAADTGAAELGRSQMNAGDYNGAIQTFTRNIIENPKDSLSYRLRGNAYQNIGDRQKAVGDLITAARLGDQIVQSYLDYMQINWKEPPKP
jgi:tetratricopeptide (TPR) repeat protein